ncbi:MAG: hypothetical protein ACRD3E_06595 [Terriglobales bacterium]
MKFTKWTCALVIAFGCSAVLHAAPTQDEHRQENRQRDQDRARNQDQNRAESAYYSNAYYKRGWNDALKHKQSRKFRNDNDRMAYEAGYAHGQRGERWQNPNRRRNKKRDRDDQNRDRDDRNRPPDHDHR